MTKILNAGTKTLKTISDFVHHDLIDGAQTDALKTVESLFQLGMTPETLATVANKTANDPVYQQYVPSALEMKTQSDELNDPIGDGAHRVCRGLIHRYSDRVLFKVTQSCAVYCRFCFRREMLGDEDRALTEQDIENALSYIAQHPEIEEVILSGGDPFTLSPRRLTKVMKGLDQISHVRFIRFHTRIPVVKTSLINEGLIETLKSDKRVIISIHTNHANELSDKACAAIHKLEQEGITLISQTVLLRGINNKPEMLKDLFKELMGLGVKPAYLHHPDKAKGTSHFRVSIKEGQAIYNALRGQISGHCLPQYVLDIPGGFGKVPVNTDWIKPQDDGSYKVIDIRGKTHAYKD